MKPYIYADNAATTQLDKEALDAMIPWLTEDYGNPSQPYSFSRKPKEAIKSARETIADCIGADPEEIIFTSGGTESDNWAIKCFSSQPGNHFIVTSPIEHHAVLNSCSEQSNPVFYMPVDSKGVVSLGGLESILKEEAEKADASSSLVSIMFANNEIGSIQPIKEATDIAHHYNAIFHTDAVQAIGHLPVNVGILDVDILSASAHKFNGPKGVGFLYIKKGTTVSRFHSGGSQEFRMRAGTENVAGIVGMAIALKNNCAHLKENMRHLSLLEEHLIEQLHLNQVDFIRNGADNHLSGIVHLSFKGYDGEAILHRMDLLGIAISTGSACDSVNTQISHVLKAIQLDDECARGSIRVSLGKNNTTEDIDLIASSLRKIIA